MAKKKLNKQTSFQITFEGGPRDGETMLVSAIKPPPRMRLAFPEWCNYYRRDESSVYYYDMETPWVSPNAMKPETL